MWRLNEGNPPNEEQWRGIMPLYAVTKKYGYKPIDDRTFKNLEEAEKFKRECEALNAKMQFRIRIRYNE
jgi:hypothetical protein